MKIKLPPRRPNFTKPEILLQELPKPLHGITPRFVLGNQKWGEAKRKAIIDNNYCCWACGVNINDARIHQRLQGAPMFHVDHDYKVVYHRGVSALCYLCNSFLNLRSVKIMEAKNIFDKKHVQQILEHGENITNVGEKLVNISFILQINDFQNWRYNFNGIEYFSRFKNVEEYNAFFNLKKVV